MTHHTITPPANWPAVLIVAAFLSVVMLLAYTDGRLDAETSRIHAYCSTAGASETFCEGKL